MEDGACHPGYGQWEKRIDAAVGESQCQAKCKTHLVRLDVAIEPPIWPGGRSKRLPE